MQRGALAITKYPGKIEDALLSGGQQLLAGEFGRSAQIKRVTLASRADQLGRKAVQVRFIARRNLQRRRFDFNEVLRDEPRAQSRSDPCARDQKRPPVGMHGLVPLR